MSSSYFTTVPAICSGKILRAQTGITINLIYTGSPICTQMPATVIYVFLTPCPRVSRITYTFVQCNSITAVSMHARVWCAVINVDFTVGSGVSINTCAMIISIEVFTHSIMHTRVWAAGFQLRTASYNRVGRYFEELLFLWFFCIAISTCLLYTSPSPRD